MQQPPEPRGAHTTPDEPHVCEMPIEVAPHHIDVLGHVNNVVYVHWMQEVAVCHWRAAATEREQASLVWVALRHEVDYSKAAFDGDSLTARTWIGNTKGVRYERFTEIVRPADGARLVRARSEWCALSADTLRPQRVNPEVRDIFYRTPLREVGAAPDVFARSAGPAPFSKDRGP